MLPGLSAAGYGAAGGLIIEAVAMWQQLYAWQQARHQWISGKGPRPEITEFIDFGPDLAVGVTRALLGGAAGWLLRTEVTGAYAALAVGASAPALLASLRKAAPLHQVTAPERPGEPPSEGRS